MDISQADNKLLLGMYVKMVQIRTFEDKLYFLFLNTIMPGTMHQYNGEEAVAVGVCTALRDTDYITSTHRGHGHCIAKGADIDRCMAEMFAKETGLCRGMGGSMHIADFSVGMLGATGIVGASIPIATGAALSAQIRGTDNVAVCFMGDGATNEGSFHESLNMAATWKLPVIYVVENNLYGFSTRYDEVFPTSDIAPRGDGYGIPNEIVDGQDVWAVYQAAMMAVERARSGGGPTLIECKTYRYRGHSRFEPAVYRTKEEENEWKLRDPIKLWAAKLIESGISTDEDIKSIRKAVQKRMDEAVAFAEQSAPPSPELALELVFAKGTGHDHV
ncbi:MAG: thiamine pyrophosphate-dependent dehydrogenase E1 component subunit alpha [Armatimonadota bacterium]